MKRIVSASSLTLALTLGACAGQQPPTHRRSKSLPSLPPSPKLRRHLLRAQSSWLNSDPRSGKRLKSINRTVNGRSTKRPNPFSTHTAKGRSPWSIANRCAQRTSSFNQARR